MTPSLAMMSALESPSTPQERRLRAAIETHYELVWRVLRRLGVTAGSVEDAAQQVLIVFSNRLDQVTVGAERAFMVATATRVAADARKKGIRAREELNPDALAALVSPTPLADEELDRARARVLLDVALDEMPDELRAVFVLFELEELTMAAIANLLGLPPGTVASRLRRAREHFASAVAQLSQLRSRA